jgi:formamidopyrimidine-DNA glycosylase
MPELPDVEAFRQYLHSRVLHQRIERVEVASLSVIMGGSPRTLHRALRGTVFLSTHRHGKYLFLEIDRGGWLLLHFGMTGYPVVDANEQRPSDRARLRIRFANGHSFSYFDPRKLGLIGIVDHVDEFIRSRNLGPDALRVTEDVFKERLKKKATGAKAALMDQHVLAGIGNVYADEILFQARLSPLARLSLAKPPTWRKLYRVTRKVLSRAIEVRANPMSLPRTYLLHHRDRDGRCPRCGQSLQTMKVGGRTTYYCPRDQRKAA